MAYTSQSEKNLILFVLLRIVIYLKTCVLNILPNENWGSHSGVGNIQMFCVMLQGRVVKCYYSSYVYWTVHHLDS